MIKRFNVDFGCVCECWVERRDHTLHLEILVAFTPAKPKFLCVISHKHNPLRRVYWVRTHETVVDPAITSISIIPHWHPPFRTPIFLFPPTHLIVSAPSFYPITLITVNSRSSLLVVAGRGWKLAVSLRVDAKISGFVGSTPCLVTYEAFALSGRPPKLIVVNSAFIRQPHHQCRRPHNPPPPIFTLHVHPHSHRLRYILSPFLFPQL